MNKGIWLLVAAAAMLAMLPGISCGDDNDNNPADDGGGGDARDDSGGGDTGEQCPPASFPAGTAEMRLTHLQITLPAALGSGILQNLVRNSMDAEDFIWLLKFDGIGSGTVTLTTGSGAKVAGTACTYKMLAPEYPPDSMTMTETGLDFALSGLAINELLVPMWSTGTEYPAPPLLSLPLRELSISGTFSSNHMSIGAYDPTTGSGADGGTLVGKITVADAQDTVISDFGITLCGLLANETGVPGDPSDDCSGDPTTWDTPPDTTVGTEPAYNMQGTISATPVHIQP